MVRIPLQPPEFGSLLETLDQATIRKIFATGIQATVDGRYRHWDKLRHLQPPAGLNHEQWWFGIKMARHATRTELPLVDADRRRFHCTKPEILLEQLHRIDRDAAGSLHSLDAVANQNTRDTYLMRSLVDESITSSQLEGAATTTEVAKEMILSQRAPRDTSERMILNNFRAMEYVRDRKDEPLSVATILDLHHLVTNGTLADDAAAGRLRKPGEEVVVRDVTGRVLHTPPPADQLDWRLRDLIAFANGENDAGFIHPVVRAILIHFWIGYDHPFVDGNGRTARAVFYWSLLRQGYWLCEFISISEILKQAPARYARSFLYSETDENDATYFLLDQQEVVLRALDELKRYIDAKTTELDAVESALFGLRGELNQRQLRVVAHAARHPGHRYTIRSHQNAHAVSYQTARTDLLELADLGLLAQTKKGRAFVFLAPADLAQRIGPIRTATRS